MKPFVETILGTLLPPPVRRATGERILAICTALHAKGLVAKIAHDLDAIASIKRATGQRLFQIFDPRHQPQASARDTVITVLERLDNGDPIACVGSRYMRLEGTLHDAMVSRRLFYADPEATGAPSDRCVVTADAAHQIEDAELCVTGAVWIDRHYAGQHLLKPLMTLNHTYALSEWHWLWMVGFAEERVTVHCGLRDYGYDFAQAGVTLDFPAAGIEAETFLLAAKRRHARRLYLPEIMQ
jgi:hypothetical protein